VTAVIQNTQSSNDERKLVVFLSLAMMGGAIVYFLKQ